MPARPDKAAPAPEPPQTAEGTQGQGASDQQSQTSPGRQEAVNEAEQQASELSDQARQAESSAPSPTSPATEGASETTDAPETEEVDQSTTSPSGPEPGEQTETAPQDTAPAREEELPEQTTPAPQDTRAPGEQEGTGQGQQRSQSTTAPSGPDRGALSDSDRQSSEAMEGTAPAEVASPEAEGNLQADEATRERIRQILAEVRQAVGRGLSGARQIISGLTDQVARQAQRLGRAVRSLARRTLQQVSRIAGRVLRSVQGLLERLGSHARALLAGLREGASALLGRLSALGGRGAQWVRDRIQALKSAAHRQVVSMVRSVRQTIIGRLRQVAGRLAARVAQVSNVVRTLIQAGAGHAQLASMAVRAHVSALISRMHGGSGALSSRVQAAVRAMVRSIAAPALRAPARLFRRTVGRTLAALRSAFTAGVAAARRLWEGAGQTLQRVFAGPLAVVGATIPEAASELAGGIEEAEELGAMLEATSGGQLGETEGVAMAYQGMLDNEASQADIL